jgi:hypothetical protein
MFTNSIKTMKYKLLFIEHNYHLSIRKYMANILLLCLQSAQREHILVVNLMLFSGHCKYY